MDIKELLKGYFELTDDEKHEVLSKLAEIYFFQGIDLGMSPIQILDGFDPLIEEATEIEDYEIAQAFVDIKEAIKMILDRKDNQDV
jgi:hypothetical protein